MYGGGGGGGGESEGVCLAATLIHSLLVSFRPESGLSAPEINMLYSLKKFIILM